MRKFIITLLLTTMTVLSCWMSNPEYFNAIFIAGVNNYHTHYDYSRYASYGEVIYNNGQVVAQPLTVWIQYRPTHSGSSFEVPKLSDNIQRVVLQYKVLPDGNWVTVKDLISPKWNIYLSTPIALFGQNNIDIDVPDYTHVVLRLYITNGVWETGDINQDITEDIPDVATRFEGNDYGNGWYAPHVMRVVIKGRRPWR